MLDDIDVKGSETTADEKLLNGVNATNGMRNNSFNTFRTIPTARFS